MSMKALRYAVVCALLTFCPSAFADTFSIDYTDVPQSDPLENFDADCNGSDEAADCADRAVALQAELVEVLGALGLRDDDETAALFQTAVDMPDPQLQEIGLRYFAYQAPPPDDLWSKARDFFFGPQANVGQPSAELLSRSLEAADQELARVYLEGRPTSTRGGSTPSGAGLTDSWALGAAQDSLLDDVAPFTAEERFPDQTRLLMLDRFVGDPFGGDLLTRDIPVTGFVTNASTEEVEAHFKTVFGTDPYPSLDRINTQLQELNTELADLQIKLMSGDVSVAARFGQVAEQMQQLQQVSTLASRLSLASLDCSDHEFWADTSLEDALTGPLPRAVTLGMDARVGSNVIRYIGGQSSGTINPSGGTSGDGGAGENDGSGGNSDQAEGGDGGSVSTPRKDSSGCGCSLPASTHAPTWLALAPLALALRRRRAKSRARKSR